MAQVKNERPEIVSFGDHDVIMPPNRLAKAVSDVKVTTPEADPVFRAEQALDRLSKEFSGWMHEECERLQNTRLKLKTEGITKEHLQQLYHAAHDIKGHAPTFGYPSVAPAADSLCRVIEHTPEIAHIPIELIDQHVDAIRAIIREYARPDVLLIAQELTKRLRQVTEEFLIVQNRHRPDYLDSVGAPTLVPGG